MGLRITTDDKGTIIYRKDKISQAGNEYSTYSTKVSSKKQDGNWISKFYTVKFRKGVSVNNKAKILIKDSFMALDEYNGNTNDAIFVLDFDVLDEGEAPAAPVDSNGFMAIPDGMEDEMPFN